MKKKRKARKKKIKAFILIVILITLGIAFAFYMMNSNLEPDIEDNNNDNTNVNDNNNNSDNTNNQNVISEPSYANAKPTDLTRGNLILVNKENFLPRDFVPSNLTNIAANHGRSLRIKTEVYEAFKKMFAAAELEGLNLYIVSAYRSWSNQNSIFNNFVARDGVEAAETYSARPGHSEHQTGLAIDIVAGEGGQMRAFVNTMEYSWLVANAHKYGFILRYPNGKTHITGFIYEPWHWRFLGVEMANRVRNSNLTFDEFYARYIN